MRKMFWLLIVVLSMSQTASPEVRQSAAVKEFSKRVKAYVRLRKNVEDSFNHTGSLRDSAEIAAHKIELAALIAVARSKAKQGDIFTPQIAVQFRDIIHRTLQASDAQAVRRTVEDKDGEVAVVVRVNLVYPEGNPLPTASPTLLARLPELPKDLGYRIVGRSFVLMDNKTRQIVDFIPDALP